MNKKISRLLLSAAVIMTLVFTSAGMAFADTGTGAGFSGKAVKAPAPVSNLVKQAQIGMQKSLAGAATATGTIVPCKTLYGTEAATPAYLKYNQSDVIGTSTSKAGYSLQIGLTKGTTVIIDVDNSAAGNTQAAWYGVYADPNFTTYAPGVALEWWADSPTLTKPQTHTSYHFTVTQSGTYYIGVYSDTYSGITPYTENVTAWVRTISAANHTITSGKAILVGQYQAAQTNYFQFKATATGYIQASTSAGTKIALCNSGKTALSNSVYTDASSKYNSHVTFGVTKGKTYNIRVAASAYSNSDGYYAVAYKNFSLTGKGGVKKSKAVTIKKKATKKGTITAGSSRVNWYKFKLASKSKFTVTIKGDTNKKIKIAIYNSKGKRINGSTACIEPGYNYIGKALSKFPKGTYYIKLYRADKYSSGWYSVTWK